VPLAASKSGRVPLWRRRKDVARGRQSGAVQRAVRQVRLAAETRKSHAKRGLSGTSRCARCQDCRVATGQPRPDILGFTLCRRVTPTAPWRL